MKYSHSARFISFFEVNVLLCYDMGTLIDAQTSEELTKI